MAYAYVRYTGNGSTTDYTFPFSYISSDHIKVRVNGVLTTLFTFLNSSTIKFASAPANGAIIEIRRDTPKETPIVNFTDGSVLLERDLDLLATYSLYVAQEAKDFIDASITQNSLGRWDAQSARIINVADPVDPQDAATKNWAETTGSSFVSQAGTQAAAAAASASAAATSATNSASSAASSSTSAGTATSQASVATTKAAEAASSATSASSSASTATTQAGIATTKAGEAAASATAADASKTAAQSAQAAAESARDSTLAAFDSFDDRYLGPKAADPTVDNDGNALVAGALYFRTTAPTGMKVYTGSVWVDGYTDGSTLLAKASNLSDVPDKAAARTNLGLAIGTNVQAYDAATAKTNVAQSFSAQQWAAEATLTDGATISWNVASAQVAKVTLGGNRTVAAPTNQQAGAFYALLVQQDGTGSRTLSWNSVFKFPTATAPTLTTTASARDFFVFRSDGTNMYLVGRSLDVR